MYVAKCKQKSRVKFCISMSMFVFCFAGQSTTSAQETFSGCGILFNAVSDCFVMLPDSGEFEFGLLIENTGEFIHGSHIYVSGVVIDPCTNICGSAPSCLRDNTIEPCPVCGDGLVGGDEQCDDANLEDGDGCSSTCTVEDGFECTGEPSVCKFIIPTVSQWGLVTMTLMILISGTIIVRFL